MSPTIVTGDIKNTPSKNISIPPSQKPRGRQLQVTSKSTYFMKEGVDGMVMPPALPFSLSGFLAALPDPSLLSPESPRVCLICGPEPESVDWL
ncbi:hypothetical protein DPMN_095314 [Dreissena polymorpha]|uniref:Uncharacterized protein n=1 Tax=Dreissena polymorpha TaxID=45954 RepID=A0A9D4R2R3_DREPO|nr:hypothetical protein DPMN_095314 [Dreissena polymorpha]